MPVYRFVAEQIVTRIETGIWPAGTVLPAEVSLAKEFRVSVGTIRRALGDLTADGLLARRRKTGTVVTGRTPQQSLRFFYDYFRLHSRDGDLQNSTSHMLQLSRRPASAVEAGFFDLDADADVHELHRLRLVDERPVMHETIILPARLVPDFPEDPADVPERLYPMLWYDFGLKISAIREKITAELATDRDCELLNLIPPAAVLVLHEIAYGEKAQPILLNYHRACTKNDVYINEIQ